MKTGTLERTFDASQLLGSWDVSNSYSSSKFIQALGARELARKLEKRLVGGKPDHKTIEAVLVHPGECIDGRVNSLTITHPPFAGFIPSTSIANASGLVGPLFKALSYIPIPFVIQTVAEGGATLRFALVQPLDNLKGKIPFTNKDPRWTKPGARVEGAYVTTGGSLASVNSRTADEELATRWWPCAADEV